MSYTRLKVLPKPQGPFPTGCIDVMFGHSHQGTLMRLYYPSLKEMVIDKHLASWFLGYEYTKGLSKFVAPFMPSMFETLFNWSTKEAKIPSVVEAPIAEGKFPLILFSHGLSAHRTMYSTICNDLASHGFVVAALEHRDESACSTFTLSESGEKVWIPYKTLGKNVKEYPLRSKQVKIRADECTRALDALEKLNQGEIESNELPSSLPLKSFEGRIDTSQPVLAGHSFGGATAILALSRDKRFKIGLPLDPWMFPIKEHLQELSTDVTQPMLIILTEAFQNEVNFKAFSPFDLDRNRFVTLKGSVHQNQSDTPFLFGFIGRAIGGCWSSLDKDLAMILNNKLMISFICRQLGLTCIGAKLNVLFPQQHLQIGLHLQPASLETAQQLLSFQNSNNNNNNNNNNSENPAAKL